MHKRRYLDEGFLTMPNLIPGEVKRPDKNPILPANACGKFISALKRRYSPQFVKAQIEDKFPVPSQRNKAQIMIALKDMCNTPEAIETRKERRGLLLAATVIDPGKGKK